jgi:hypothetical protein
MRSIVVVIACWASRGHAQRTMQQSGVPEWEIENSQLYSAGELNTAELGLANLKMAMRTPSLFSEVTELLRHPEGRAQMIEMMADPEFQDQAKEAADKLKVDGQLPNFLRLEYYAQLSNGEEASAESVLHAAEAAAAFNALPGSRAGKRLSDVKMQFGKARAQPKAKEVKGKASKAPAKAAPKVAPKAAKAAPKVAPRAAKASFKAAPSSSKITNRDRSQAGTLAALQADAEELNPVIKYWDPLTLGTQEFWGQSNAATIGFLRHAEIKHGRVAMAGFIGFCFHENSIHFPWKPFDGYEGLPAAGVWDALPLAARLQIVTAIGFFEIFSETQYVLEADGQAHYMRGGKPGYFPSFKTIPHPVPLNLWDPFGFTLNLSDAEKARKLKIEVNNGRLAMLGLISVLAASKSDEAVPVLNGLIKRYDGNVMAPFEPGVNFR